MDPSRPLFFEVRTNAFDRHLEHHGHLVESAQQRVDLSNRVRPAEAFLPNSSSCGNQPAYISLTAPSRTDTHANSSPWTGHRSGAREPIRVPLRPAPLNKPTY